MKSEDMIAAMRGVLKVGNGLEVCFCEGVEPAHDHVHPGGGVFFAGNADTPNSPGKHSVSGYVANIHGDRIEIAFGWDELRDKPLDGVGSCTVYGNSVYGYRGGERLRTIRL